MTPSFRIAVVSTLLFVFTALANPVKSLDLDDVYAALQIYEAVDKTGKAFFDLQIISDQQVSEERLLETLTVLSDKAEEVIPFYTQEVIDSLKIEIIRITNLDEYNIGSGYVSLGEASLRLVDGEWTLGDVTFEDKATDE